VDIGIVGGGINGLSCAWQLAECGHSVTVYERGDIMRETSQASSKLLHGGLRYLENREFRLVREALQERDAWIRRVPDLAWPLRLVLPIYKSSRRPRWMVAAGLFFYDRIAGQSILPPAVWLSAQQLTVRDPSLSSRDLIGGYEFSDGQMDDYRLGLWVADQARERGVRILEHSPVTRVGTDGSVRLGETELHHELLLNIAGPWAKKLLQDSDLDAPYELDLVRGSHLILDHPSPCAYLLEVPMERRIFFVLPWKQKTLVGTTEVRQQLDSPTECHLTEQEYLLSAFQHYFPKRDRELAGTFAGLRPLLRSSIDPNRATREYAIHREGRLLTVFGGKWTTSLALASKITQMVKS
jgi:glycerol-3-phosphate dehydrogenase